MTMRYILATPRLPAGPRHSRTLAFRLDFFTGLRLLSDPLFLVCALRRVVLPSELDGVFRRSISALAAALIVRAE